MKITRRHQVSLTFLKCLLCILLLGLTFPCVAQEPKTETKPAEKSKAPEDWRKSEKRFLALLKIESFEEKFDANFFDGFGAITVGNKFNRIMDKNGGVLAVQWMPSDPELAKLTVEQIRRVCGKPYVTLENEEWWGRLGYIIKEDKTIWFQAIRDISLLKKPEK